MPDGVNSAYDYSAEDVTYSYDDRNQLTGADYAGVGQSDETYNYDDNGNRSTGITNSEGTEDYATGTNNQMTSDGVYTYEYDKEGNRTARFIDDGDGMLDAGDTAITEYEWDHRNRLTKVMDKATYGGTPTQVVDHAYDAFNRWIKRDVDTDNDGNADEQTLFVHDNGQVVLQFDRSDNQAMTEADLSHRYLWGPAVDQLLADEQVDDLFNAANNETLWALTDHLGSVRDVVDDAGNVRIHRAFDSYEVTTDETHYNTSGSVVTAVQTGYVEIIVGFTGKILDASTGLQNNWNRWLDLRTGKWMSEDPIGFAAGDANLGRYVGNDPTHFTDSIGLQSRRPDDMSTVDGTGRFHGPIPKEIPEAWRNSEKALSDAVQCLEEDVAARKLEGLKYGGLNPSHEGRLNRSKQFLRKLKARLRSLGKSVKSVGPAVGGACEVIEFVPKVKERGFWDALDWLWKRPDVPYVVPGVRNPHYDNGGIPGFGPGWDEQA